MAIKAGQILFDAEGTLIARAQDAGITNMNFPKEKVYELGNFHTVGIIRDIPDLSFDVNSVAVDCSFEAILQGIDPSTVDDGDEFDFGLSKPLDVISPIKVGNNLYSIVNGVIVPYLTLETVSYKFGLRANAGQTFTMRSDATYYTPGSPYFETHTLSGAGPYSLAHTANPYFEEGVEQFVNAMCWVHPSGTYGRLFFGHHWTDTATTFTLTAAALAIIPSGSTIKVCYGSLAAATYPQSLNDATAPPLLPSGVRSRDIDVYIGTSAATPVFTRVEGVQAFNVDRKVNLDKDEEFGNAHFVSQDYDTADVTGQLQVKPENSAALFSLVRQLAGVPSGETAGVLSTVQLPVELRISDPADRTRRLKTLYIPDAVFNPPPIQGRVQTKLTVNFDFESEGGQLLVYSGDRTGT